jgi:sec-independent protein translocase protein TatA
VVREVPWLGNFSNFQWTEIHILKLLLVLVILLLLFSHRLPSVARSVGQSVFEFKKGVRDAEDEIQDKPE